MANSHHPGNEITLLQFLEHFEALHPKFYENLLKKAPDLSQQELHICALKRSAYSMEEMERMLGIKFTTVDNHSSVIRRKLGLQQGTKLYNELLKF